MTDRLAQLNNVEIDFVSGGHGDHQHTEAEAKMEKEINDMTGGNWHCTTRENGQIWCVEAGNFQTPKTIGG